MGQIVLQRKEAPIKYILRADALSARLPHVAVLGFERTEPKDRRSCKRRSSDIFIVAATL